MEREHRRKGEADKEQRGVRVKLGDISERDRIRLATLPAVLPARAVLLPRPPFR